MGTDIRTECTNDKIRLSHPQLADPIQEKSYKELIWTVDDPEKQGQDKQKLVYCNEYFKCHKYNITGRYQQRIETTAAVRGVLYIKQKKFNDKLTYTCRVIQKGNKPPCDYTITVSSSANCEWIKLNMWIGSVFPFSRLAVALASWGEGGWGGLRTLRKVACTSALHLWISRHVFRQKECILFKTHAM